MGIFSRIKNYLSEEVDETEEIEPVKAKIETPKPAVPIQNVSKVEGIKQEPVKKDEKFVFPVYFDDKDFDDIAKKDEPKREPLPKREMKVEAYREKTKEPLHKESSYKEAYNKKNEIKEEKHFKPTPIISPVYGILDKNYYKEDIVVTPISRSSYYGNDKPLTIDDVRKKAYGTLEDDLEKNLLYGTENLSKYGKNDDSIFDENDFANAVEEDKKRDISKDNLKSDIESLLNNEEFTKSFHFEKTNKTKEEALTNIDDDSTNNKIDKDLSSNESADNKDFHDENIDYQENDLNVNNFDDLDYMESDLDSSDDNILGSNDNVKNKIDKNINMDKKSSENGSSKEDNMDKLPTSMADNEIENAYANTSDLNDSDLFNLIDSMYEEEK